MTFNCENSTDEKLGLLLKLLSDTNCKIVKLYKNKKNQSEIYDLLKLKKRQFTDADLTILQFTVE